MGSIPNNKFMFYTFKVTRPGEVGKNQSSRQSSRLSPYFRYGCLSVRYAYQRGIGKVPCLLITVI